MGNNFIKSKNEESIIPNTSWSLNETQDALLQSSFKNLPNEIILHIFGFLSVSDLCNVSLVCRSFKMIVDHDEIWKPRCNTSLKLYSKSYRQMYIEWIQQRSLRNEKLKKYERIFQYRTACIICALPLYPLRPTSIYELRSIISFNQHPNSTEELTINLSVDINKTARTLITLLEKTSQFQKQWKQPIILKQMIQRYYRFMQLKASHSSNILLIPTIDIENIWQTHLLRPEIYRNDCLRLFRHVIDHSLILKNDIEQFYKEQAFLDTCQLYEEKFGEKYCELPLIRKKKRTFSNYSYCAYESIDDDDKPIYSYWDETSFKFSSNISSDYENPFTFTENDIILDSKWLDLCKQFMFTAIKKVPIRGSYMYGPDEIDLGPQAMKRLKKSYERFLYMAAKYPLKDGNGFIPPTYAIDIVWHSHMQEPLNYEADCLRLVGYVIYHNPWSIVEDEKMKKSCDQINQIWKSEFQCDIETDHLYHTLNNDDFWFDED